MLDFVRVGVKEPRGKSTVYEVYPDLIVGRSKDLMIRGKTFYAIWDEELGLWSTDEYDVRRLVDAMVLKEADKLREQGLDVAVKLMGSYDSGRWDKFQRFCKAVSDNSHQLDSKLTFANTEVKKTDYVSKRLPYSLAPGDHSAWDELVSILYSPAEREKIEWAIGAIVSGDSRTIEKFLVFFGPGGTGKSTILKIIQKLFEGYIAMFEAKALVNGNNAFATSVFRNNPLVAIQHDGDLSKIEDNSLLNSVVGHDKIPINEKHKAGYEATLNAMLFMGTNKPVKITDAKSGLIRRLIDIQPTGEKLDFEHYQTLMQRIDFELGAIAHHCLQVYRGPGLHEHKGRGKNRYGNYKPVQMMFKTDPFFNYVEWYIDVFRDQNYTTLMEAWKLYKVYAEEAQLSFKLQLPHFREALKDYFDEFIDRGPHPVDGTSTRSIYLGFNGHAYRTPIPETDPQEYSLVLDSTESILDEMYGGQPAQYANAAGNPKLYWDDSERIDKETGEPFIPKPNQVVSTTLGDLDTTKLHFMKVPSNHIVADFDLTDENGEKSLELNMAAASTWPPTYAEISKSGKAIHLHYIWDGDVSELANKYSDGIEIKVYNGNGSLRRKLSKCNNIAVATISSGLPFKEKKVLPRSTIQNEQGLRTTIMKCLRKEVHGGTKPEMEFIKHILDNAYNSGAVYDVSDMEPKIMAFANNSKKHARECYKILAQLKLRSEKTSEDIEPENTTRVEVADERIVFFDCEVFKNLFVVCWKYQGTSEDSVVRMINPSPAEIANLIKGKLVGFNNRDYDNHILWARILGASNMDLYKLSQRIINDKDRTAKFGEAYNLSYADVYDFSSMKMGLKPWEIFLGIKHVESKHPWDEEVPDDKILEIVDYCCNDVNALEKVFDYCHQDFVARQILADLSGLTVNSTNRKHTERILFGMEREPQRKFVYTDLSKEFPGYKFDEYAKGDKSFYKGVAVGEGGYVFGKPGMYRNVDVLDVASMHPTSIIQLNLFGPYTEKFKDLYEARLTIKNLHGALSKGQDKKADNLVNESKLLLGGELWKHVEEIERIQDLKARIQAYLTLEQALKLVLNSVYGYTAATFPNPFKDPRNKDNIVAKRGALFMVDLKEFIENLGYEVIHIKTDSVKIANSNPAIVQEVIEFGRRYGYEFAHETTYEKICLVNDAVYIAKNGEGWHATGAEFKDPVVFKTLFTGEQIDFKDLCQTKQSRDGSVMYLVDGDHRLQIGKTGLFVPVKKEHGGKLVKFKNEKDYAVPGTKGYYWAEADTIRELAGDAIERMAFEPVQESVPGTGGIADILDMGYFENVVQDAIETIDKFCDFKEFVE
jgi:energy-coupling factor transporter ATP-binding protein EcfA2